MVWNPFAKMPAAPAAERREPTLAPIQAAGEGGTTVLSSDPRVMEFFGVEQASSGVAVTPHSAKCVSAAYACSRLISGAIAVLPLKVYERGTGRTRAEVDHDVWWLLNEQPFPTLTSATWLEWMVDCMLMRGDGISEIKRKRNFEVSGFMPLPREAVLPERSGSGLIYLVGDYQSAGDKDSFRAYGLDQEDVLHVPGFGWNGVRGESVIQYAARQSIGTALAADEFSGRFFSSGMNAGTVIKYPAGVSPDPAQQQMLRDQFEERYTGRVNSHKPLLLVNGGELQKVALSANDAQLIQTRQFQVVDIARAFGVPPHMIGETTGNTSWGSGIEQMSIGFVRYTLGPHLKRIEQELNRKLWLRSEKYFVEFDREALLAGDSKAEAEYFSKALGGPGTQGWLTVNDVRQRKNMSALPGWDDVQKAGAKPVAGVQDEPADPATKTE